MHGPRISAYLTTGRTRQGKYLPASRSTLHCSVRANLMPYRGVPAGLSAVPQAVGLQDTGDLCAAIGRGAGADHQNVPAVRGFRDTQQGTLVKI